MARKSHSDRPLDAFNCPIEDLKWTTPGVDQLVARMFIRGLFRLSPYKETLEDIRSKKRVDAWARKLAKEDERKHEKLE